MKDNFNLKKYLVENKLTPASQKIDEFSYSPEDFGNKILKVGSEITLDDLKIFPGEDFVPAKITGTQGPMIILSFPNGKKDFVDPFILKKYLNSNVELDPSLELKSKTKFPGFLP